MANVNRISKEGLDKLKAELNELVNIKRPDIIKQIQKAREEGDLSENADYDAAISISTALMSVFIITIEVCFQDDSFSEGLQFIANNLKSIFIQVPLIVWKHQMITRKTVEVFLNLMHCLIRHVGRDNNIELHNRSLQAFLKLTVSENSPYPDLIQTANTVMKFYSDI